MAPTAFNAQDARALESLAPCIDHSLETAIRIYLPLTTYMPFSEVVGCARQLFTGLTDTETAAALLNLEKAGQVRRKDASLPPEQSHWLCVRL